MRENINEILSLMMVQIVIAKTQSLMSLQPCMELYHEFI